MTYTFDTNIILHLLRGTPLAEKIKNEVFIKEDQPFLIISVVTQAELESIAIQRNYGSPKRKALKKLLEEFLRIDIDNEDLIKRYAEIDAFSQGNLEGRPLEMSARNMGKNDLWIAATASIIDSTLLTTDRDFDHLEGIFIQLVKI